MDQLKVFNFEENEVRTLAISDEPYFVAVDVCKVLEIKNARDAVTRLDEDEKATSVLPTQYGNKEMHLINESGLYALIFTSRKEEAKHFRKWVTSEVLPQIRRTGKYEAPKDPMEIMRLQFEALDQTNKEVKTIKEDVTYLKNEVKLDAGEYDYLSRNIKRTVAEAIQVYGYAGNGEVKKELFKDINRGVSEICGVRTRTQLRQKHFDKAMQYVNAWVPSTATRMKVQQLTMNLNEESVND